MDTSNLEDSEPLMVKGGIMKATSLTFALVVASLIGCWSSGVDAAGQGNENDSNRILTVPDGQGGFLQLPRLVPRNADPMVVPGLRHQIGVLMDQNRVLFEGARQQSELLAGLITSVCNLGSGGRLCPARDRKIVFVTSSLHYGTIPGVAAADFVCNVRAVSAGLTGHFLAWISDSETTEPRVRFVHSQVPYILPSPDDGDPLIVADNWDALTTMQLQHRINRDEFGNLVPESLVWTATFNDGSHITAHDSGGNPASVDCDDWETSESSVIGLLGSTDRINASWSFDLGPPEVIIPTVVGAAACSKMARLYCFEQ